MAWSNLNVIFLILASGVVIWGTLARFFPCNPGQPRYFSKGLAQDVLYCLMLSLIFGGAAGAMQTLGAEALFGERAPVALAAARSGYGGQRSLPLVVQAALVLVICDIIQYWAHRLFHGRALWPFHAVHHGAQDIDWTTGYRFHPVNYVIYSSGVAALVGVLGFSPGAFLIIAPFNLVVSGLVHANLNWTFGPFRYVLASPVFHRWHHVRDPNVRNRNFAPTFPILDVIFGTFYMPEGKLPADYGAEGVPADFIGQMIHPFAVLASRAPSQSKAPLDRAEA
jgi:sterol desaturase/sphingolipid hydroxylase (fatty acid hydroxylase superfamily)